MRQITSNSVSQLLNRVTFRQSNTSVTCHYGKTNVNEPQLKKDTNFTRLTLFGHTIAIYTEDNRLFISNADYFTNTTKERLNGLGAFGKNVNIKQKQGVWYLNDKEWNGKWIEIF